MSMSLLKKNFWPQMKEFEHYDYENYTNPKKLVFGERYKSQYKENIFFSKNQKQSRIIFFRVYPHMTCLFAVKRYFFVLFFKEDYSVTIYGKFQ